MSVRKTRALRAFGKVLFLLYVGFLIYFLFLAEWYGRTGVSEEYRYNLELFREIKRFIIYRDQLGAFAVFANLAGNILIFVPYGFFISMASRSRGFFKTLFFSMGLSLCVEITQLFSRVGSFDVDDILLNTVGGVVGYIIFLICNAIRRKHYARNRKKR
ncbi:MAG TPA: VanZ family protein [Candidatus Mediterraneibacter pullicola]|uniref:VanZ family protein n=1 Tax=Candidatus Mediterraneibacter pullicola TaxID=2838682 RepID=A0A9D2KIQ8_9FIRM|nr:VanZ family protein [Candidatus Mediterraneibacter pullicola]